MKTTPSRYILAAEILAISLFHTVKIKQAEKHPVETVLAQSVKNTAIHKPIVEDKTGIEYMLVNLLK